MRAARKSYKAGVYLPLFINISLWTAQRKRAVLGLQWEPNEEGGHVDLERGVIHFPPEGRAQTKKRKTKCVIPARSVLMLRAAKRRTKRYVIERPGRPHERLNDIANSFETACFAAGLEMKGVRRVTPHTLGHTSITWMLERDHIRLTQSDV
jgi:integrase